MKVMADHEKDLLEMMFRAWRSAVASTRSTRIDRPDQSEFFRSK